MSLASKIINALIQMICLPVLLMAFGKENYGLIVIAMSLNTFIAIIQLGLPSGIPKYVAEWLARDDQQKLTTAMQTVSVFYMGMALLNGLVLLGIAFFGLNLFNIHPEQVETLRILLVITAITSFFSIPASALDQLLTGAQELAFVSCLEMVKNGFFALLVLSIFMIPDSLSLIEFYAMRCGLMFLMIPFKLWRWTKRGRLRAFWPSWNFPAVRPLLFYCLSMMVFSVFSSISKNITPLILAARVPDNAGAVMADYQVINYVQMMMMMIVGSLMAALVPHISAAASGGDQKIFKKTIVQGTKVVWSFGALVGFGVIMLSREVILVYVGPDYLHLSFWLQLYVVAILYNLYSPAMASAILASGKLIPLVYATGIGCIVSLATCWILAPKFGVGSVAFAMIGYILVYFVVTHFWYFPKYFKINPINQICKVLLPPVLAGVLMCVAGRWIINLIGSNNSWMNIGIGAVAGTGMYLVVILVIYIRPSELKSMVLMLRNN